MNKQNVCAILMITAAVLAVVTLTEVTNRIPKEYFMEKIWLLDYGDLGGVPENQHIFFYITAIDDGEIKGNFTLGETYRPLYTNEFWVQSGEISGNIENGIASCRFVREPLDKEDEGINLDAALTFEEGGRIGIQFKDSETASRLIFHESYQSYRPYNLNDIENIKDLMKRAEKIPIDTGYYAEETFFFRTAGMFEWYGWKELAFVVDEKDDILLCCNIYVHGRTFKGKHVEAITLEDANGDGRTDIAVTINYKPFPSETETQERHEYTYILYQQQNGMFNRIEAEEL